MVVIVSGQLESAHTSPDAFSGSKYPKEINRCCGPKRYFIDNSWQQGQATQTPRRFLGLQAHLITTEIGELLPSIELSIKVPNGYVVYCQRILKDKSRMQRPKLT
jgi:hypothetical protein